ncbi:MAG: hypothetical protein F6K28_59720 [Microcoleus sp. SIO2G3]|nr:hypothetical protein [Microcoleus sp. SIO2G3]
MLIFSSRAILYCFCFEGYGEIKRGMTIAYINPITSSAMRQPPEAIAPTSG